MKTNWTLLDFSVLEEVAKVLQEGCGKHIADSWKNEPIGGDIESLLRHVLDYEKGIKVDRESGLHSLAHAMCRCMFIIYKDKKKNKQCEATQKIMDMERLAKDNEHYCAKKNNEDSTFECAMCEKTYKLKEAAGFSMINNDLFCYFCTQLKK